MDPFQIPLMIGGCAFNCAKMLPRVLDTISRMAACFRTVHVVFFYDVSKDTTLQMLQAYQQQQQQEYQQQQYQEHQQHQPPTLLKVTLLINPVHQRTNSRTVNIARARNGILQVAQQEQCPLLAMIDLNEYACVGALQLETFKSVFSSELWEQWDAISFNREAGYYDYWALSFPGFIYSFLHYNNSQQVVTKMRHVFGEVLQQQQQTQELIPVYSAFNGFSLYKLKQFKDCTYSARINLALFPQHELQNAALRWGRPVPTLDNDCEHRHFHLQAIQKHGARLRIYPHSLFKKLPVKESIGLRGPA